MRARRHCPSHSAKLSSSWLTAKAPVALLRVGAAGECSSMGSARRHLLIFSAAAGIIDRWAVLSILALCVLEEV